MESSHTTPEQIDAAATLRRLEATVERATGQSANELRSKTLSELRILTEKKVGRRMKFISRFPLIGRGNVMRDKVVDHDSIEGMLERLLR